jgi:hypothetical protein
MQTAKPATGFNRLDHRAVAGVFLGLAFLITVVIIADPGRADPPAAPTTFPTADISIAEFEGPDYAGWTKTGTAFDPGPLLGDMPAKFEISNYG